MDNPGDDPRPVVVAAGVSKRYRRTPVLDEVSLTVHRGEIVALLGSNGTGKSTLLRLLAGRERPDRGSLERRGRAGYAPQAGGLDPYLTAEEHLELFGAAHGLDRTSARAEGLRLARELDWEPPPLSIVAELSGGTRQKLRIVTSMLGQPDLLLLDEPYQGLDAESAHRFWKLLAAGAEAGGAIVIASHAAEVLDHATQTLELGAVA